jgi:hypothetical protein
MWRFRYLWICLFLDPMLPWAANGQQPGTSPPRPAADKQTPSAPRQDAKGTKLLKDAISTLDPQRRPWVETTLWQQVDVQGLRFQAEGTYRTAPEHRLRLELNVRLGDTPGRLTMVSDGTTVWESVQVGKGPPEVAKTQLKKVLETLAAPGMLEQVRTDFFQAQAFAGVVPLLQRIEQQMIVTNQEPAHWRGRDVVRLTAFWSEGVAKTIVPADRPWPTFLPRKCYLYLDAKDSATKYWPYRVEWWGPVPPGNEDGLVVQMEFRDPKLDQPLPPERLAQEFRFDPGSLRVEDVTDPTCTELRNRSRQLAGRKPGD